MDNNNKIQDRIIEKLSFIENRECIDLYFDLVKEVLQVTGLKSEDSRLSMSLSPKNRKWFFPVNINNRYVIAMRRNVKINRENSLGVSMILPSYADNLPELKNEKILRWGNFEKLSGEQTTPPFFVYFEDLYEIAALLNSSLKLKSCWHEALIAEVNRRKASTFRKFHQPEVYRFVMDKNFRNEILDRKYKRHESDRTIFPEEIDDLQRYFEGAVKSIRVNAYERNSQVRNLCIKEYGTKL